MPHAQSREFNFAPYSPMKATPLAFPNSRHRFLSRGFTLTELLVVITIIIVLVALTFSVVTRMKTSASKSREMNNIRNIAQIVTVYHADVGTLPGPLNRAVQPPTRRTLSAKYNLADILIAKGYVQTTDKDDALWLTSMNVPEGEKPSTTYIVNSNTNSLPAFFFGQGAGSDLPRPISALVSNLNTKVTAHKPNAPLWMLCTADEENYGAGALISHPVTGKSSWGGRFYAYFDGQVEFIKREAAKSTYPSSFDGNYK